MQNPISTIPPQQLSQQPILQPTSKTPPIKLPSKQLQKYVQQQQKQLIQHQQQQYQQVKQKSQASPSSQTYKMVINNKPIYKYKTNVSNLIEGELFMFEGEWELHNVVLKKYEIKFDDFLISLDYVTKLKIYREDCAEVDGRKFKMCLMHQPYFFAVRKESAYGVDMQYYWFSRIINLRLEQLGYFSQLKFDETQNLQSQQQNTTIIIHGTIYKKSQYLGKWEPRIVTICKQGLKSYKNGLTEPSFEIKRSTIKEMWTRFDLYEGCLIIKLMHQRKTEFAIPLTLFYMKHVENWLLAFYQLMTN